MGTMTNEKIVEMTTVMKNKLRGSVDEAYKKVGLDATKYANGLMLPSVSPTWTMEDNIKNVLSIFCNNYAHSVFFQAKSSASDIKEERTIAFLKSKGLLNEFKEYVNLPTYQITTK